MVTLARLNAKTYAEYSETGNRWLGQVPSSWSVKPLFAIARIKSEVNHSEKELLSVYLDKGVIRFSDVDEKRTNVTSLDLSKYQLVREGDFVLNNQQAWRGSVGVSGYEGIVSPAYIVLSLSQDLAKRFANYLFRNQHMVSQYLVFSKGVGTIQRNLYYPHLKRALIAFPELDEQTAIANFLDEKTEKIDRVIAQKERLIELLQERKQILIQNAVTKGLDPNVKLKDSGVEWIGEIPKHWDIKALKHVLLERSQKSVTGEEPLFMMSQVYGLVVRSDFHEKAEVAETNVGNKLVYHNDLVFNKLKAHLGVFFKSEIEYVGLVSPDYAVYHSKGVIVDLKLLEYLFRLPQYIGQFIVRATGIVEGLIRLYTAELFAIKIPIPPKKEQVDILNEILKIERKIETSIDLHAKQIEKLKEYRSTLIDSAVTGKIKVI